MLQNLNNIFFEYFYFFRCWQASLLNHFDNRFFFRFLSLFVRFHKFWIFFWLFSLNFNSSSEMSTRPTSFAPYALSQIERMIVSQELFYWNWSNNNNYCVTKSKPASNQLMQQKHSFFIRVSSFYTKYKDFTTLQIFHSILLGHRLFRWDSCSLLHYHQWQANERISRSLINDENIKNLKWPRYFNNGEQCGVCGLERILL